MNDRNPSSRIVIIPFLHGKLTADGKLSEPDIYFILEKWMERHPEFRGRERVFRITRGQMHLPEGFQTELLRVTAENIPELAGYDPIIDADLYEYFLEDKSEMSQAKFHKIWIEQCEAAKAIEGEFGFENAIEYLVGEKFINYLDAAEIDKSFRDEIPAFAGEIKQMFERWQLAVYLDKARSTEPFDPSVYDDPEVAETERQLELRQSANELLLVERARDWLLEE